MQDKKSKSCLHRPLLLTSLVSSWSCTDFQAVDERPRRQVKKSVQDLAVYTTREEDMRKIAEYTQEVARSLLCASIVDDAHKQLAYRPIWYRFY